MNEVAVTEAINHFGRGTILDSISQFISWWVFIGALFIAIALLVLWKDKKRGKTIFVAIIIALVLYFMVTEVVFKEVLPEYFSFDKRPYLAYPGDISPIGKLSTDVAFPSGHVSIVMAFFTVIAFYYRKYWPYAFVFVLLMGLSRIHNGMHYPSDVIAGLIFGFVYGAVGIWAAKRLMSEKKKINNN